MKKLESDEQQPSEQPVDLADLLSSRARLKGMLGHYDEGQRMENAPPEIHVFISGDTPVRLHTWETKCWCDPYIEYATEFVTVYRHRRFN